MIPDPVLTLAWLVLAHFVADFVLQTDRIAIDKGADGRRALYGMALHTAAVGVCLVPVVLAFGGPGVSFLLVVTLSHALVDRAKIVWTRRADAAVAEVARTRQDVRSTGLGPAWTPVPGALFILDQVVHLAITAVFFAVFLAGVPLTAPFADFVGLLFARWDPAVVHEAILWVVVVASLLIVNVRAASFFVSTLVMPRPVPASPPPESEPVSTTTTVRVGPFLATTETTTTPAHPVTAAVGPVEPPPPDRVGETIGVLERLLVVIFVLGEAGIAVGLVIAAKTIARFRQLDDRAFAEYYLLGTLASVTVAVVSALIAAAALGL